MELCFNYDMDDEVRFLLEIPSVVQPKSEAIRKTKKTDIYKDLCEEIRELGLVSKTSNETEKPEKKNETLEKSDPFVRLSFL